MYEICLVLVITLHSDYTTYNAWMLQKALSINGSVFFYAWIWFCKIFLCPYIQTRDSAFPPCPPSLIISERHNKRDRKNVLLLIYWGWEQPPPHLIQFDLHISILRHQKALWVSYIGRAFLQGLKLIYSETKYFQCLAGTGNRLLFISKCCKPLLLLGLAYFY